MHFSTGYYEQMKNYLEENYLAHEEFVLELILRPFRFYETLSVIGKETVLLKFSENFLCSQIKPKIKNVLLPHVVESRLFPYNDFVTFLNNGNNFKSTNGLLYSLLILEPLNYGKLT